MVCGVVCSTGGMEGVTEGIQIGVQTQVGLGTDSELRPARGIEVHYYVSLVLLGC